MNYPYQVSIIIPTYRRSELLRETLLSVESQTYRDWECLVINDENSDDTKRIVAEFIANNPRFKYFQRPEEFSKGACGARNYGFKKSKGKYIQWLDDDDLLSPNKLELQVEHLNRLNDTMFFVTCSWDMYWPGKEFVSRNILKLEERLNAKEFFQKLHLHQTFVPSHAYLTPRELIKNAGLWDTELTINQDGEFFARVILNAKKLCNTPNCFVLYRIHGGTRISRKYNSQNLISLLHGFKLIHSHLNKSGIKNPQFFRWKLLKIVLTFWKSDMNILKSEKKLFKENNIDLSKVRYYFLKYKIYKIIMPIYKSFKLKEKF